MSIFGTRLMGKCDAVPGFFHVATQFFHINFVPLIPLKTYLVPSRTGNNFRGVQMPLSGKTVALAWGRVITFVGALSLTIIAITEVASPISSGTADRAILVGIALASIAAYLFLMLHPLCTRASAARAFQLAERVGLNEAGLAKLQEIYGPAAGRGFPVMPPRPSPPPIRTAPAAKPPTDDVYPCRVCGNRFSVDSCYSEANGQTICQGCWSANQSGAPA